MVEASELHGDFVLSSGATSTIYFDKFRFLTRPDLLDQVAAEVARLLAPSTELLGAPEGAAMLLVAAERPDASLAVTALGRTFATPLGMAAGFDKGAEMYNALGALGFGAVEVGTITAEAQPGNPRPRLFRLVRDRAIVNRMGFNNAGAEVVAQRLASLPSVGVPLGISLGKSKVTPLEDAAGDYLASLDLLYS